MAGWVRVGDGSSHGGVVTTGASNTSADGLAVSRVGDLHSCPIMGHGITAISNGSATINVEGAAVALQGISVAGCGAVITGGSSDVIGS